MQSFMYMPFHFLPTQTSFQAVTLSFRNAKPVGFQNYFLVLTHDLFYQAVFNTFVFAGILVLASLTLGFRAGSNTAFIWARCLFFHIYASNANPGQPDCILSLPRCWNTVTAIKMNFSEI